MENPSVVKITFQRIQSFLFAVPRLKAMLGANVLLAEVLRRDLPERAIECGSKDCRFGFVIQAGGWLTESPSFRDPLQDSSTDPNLLDDPETLYGQGILARDGGHFQAVFSTERQATEFINKANELITRKLPGLRYTISPETGNIRLQAPPPGHQSLRLPHFMVCEDTGNEIASHLQTDEHTQDTRYVSKQVVDLEDAGMRFTRPDQTTCDIIGLLESKLPLSDLQPPGDLDQLAGRSGYIALVHADGNGMGKRRQLWAGDAEQFKNSSGSNGESFIQRENRNEIFFHAMRIAVRRAVIDALTATYRNFDDQTETHRPYQLLMLGGDDVLLLCRPEHAFHFSIALAEKIAEHPVPFKENEPPKPISMGIGVAIAKKNVPFYLLHELAEQLAASAKKLYRMQPHERSVIDWNTATTSWINDITGHRRQHDQCEANGKIWCGLARPYFVQGDGKSDFHLQHLHRNAGAIYSAIENKQAGGNGIARSQLKEIAGLIQRKQPEHAQAQYERFLENLASAEQEQTLSLFKRIFPDNDIWRQYTEQQANLTQFRDLIDLVEINYLGRQQQNDTWSGDNE